MSVLAQPSSDISQISPSFNWKRRQLDICILSQVEDPLSRPMLDKGQLEGFPSSDTVFLESLNKLGQHVQSASTGGGTSGEGTDAVKTACLAASVSTATTIANDICQHNRHEHTGQQQHTGRIHDTGLLYTQACGFNGGPTKQT